MGQFYFDRMGMKAKERLSDTMKCRSATDQVEVPFLHVYCFRLRKLT